VPVGVLRIRLEAHNHAVGDDDKGHHGLQKPGSRSSRTWLLKYVEISQTQVTLDLKWAVRDLKASEHIYFTCLSELCIRDHHLK
jgi:hypothetical protein